MSARDFARDGWVRAPATAADYRQDALLAVALAVGTSLSALLYWSAGFYEEPAPVWVAALCIIGITVPIAFRRRFPLTVALVVSAVFVAFGLLRVPEILFINIGLFVALYSAGAWSRHRGWSIVVRLGIIAGMFGWLFFEFATQGSAANAFFDPDESHGPVSVGVAFGLINVFTNVLYFGGAYYSGERARNSARAREELAMRTAELESQREQTAAQAVTRERLRIARELHDVVAHHVSVMGVQAGAARVQLGKDPARAAESLTAVESSARTAVDELHQLLATLRDDEVDAAAESPSTRGVTQLEPLVLEATSAGLPIRYSVVGDPFPLPPTVDLSVYRIAQEAITNSIKHAGAGATADVRLRYLTDSVEIEVSDTGSGARRGRGARLGQLGMRERVNAVGGTVEFGPRERGGYLVRARIPVPS